MTMVLCAVNPPTRESLSRLLGNGRDISANSQLLIDSALVDTALLDRWLASHGLVWRNAYAGSPLDAFGPHAPRLIPCAHIEPDAIAYLLKNLAPPVAISVIELHEDADPSALPSVLAYLATVRIEAQKKPVHCRVADTRVLAALLQILEAEQLLPLEGTVHRWRWFGRVQGEQIWRSSRSVKSDVVPSTLNLRINQFREMQRACEADVMFTVLQDRVPELVPQDRLGVFHENLRAHLAVADHYGVHAIEDRIQFLVLSLSCGTEFHRNPRLLPTWEAVRKGTGLAECMQSWDDLIWLSLEQGTPHAQA